MRGGAAGGLWHHQTWSPSLISPRIRNQVKTATIGTFLCLTCKIPHKKVLRIILCASFTLFLDQLLLMTSNLAAIVTSPSPNLSQIGREGKTNCYCKRDVLSPRKKLRKTLDRGGNPPPPPLYVRGLIWSIFYLSKKKLFKISLRKQEFNIPCKFYLMSKAFLLTPSLSLTSFITCSSGSSSDLILCKKKENYTSALAKCIYF